MNETYYQKNREKVLAYRRKYYQKNRERYLPQMKKYREANKEKAAARTREWIQKNKEKVSLIRIRTAAKRKRECLEAYGGAKCAHCGFMDIRALQIDHVNGGGTKESIEKGYHRAETYRYLRRNGYPDKDKYQVLCANCNLIKRIENKECKSGIRISK